MHQITPAGHLANIECVKSGCPKMGWRHPCVRELSRPLLNPVATTIHPTPASQQKLISRAGRRQKRRQAHNWLGICCWGRTVPRCTSGGASKHTHATWQAQHTPFTQRARWRHSPGTGPPHLPSSCGCCKAAPPKDPAGPRPRRTRRPHRPQ